MRLPGSSLFCKVLLLFNGTFTIHLVSGTPNLMENVNTLIGTSYFENQFDVHDYGNTAPFAGPPFAHTPWTAQTRDSEDKCQSPYYYFDSYWHGMRRSHWMSGSCTIDYGSATIIPSVTNNLMEALTYHTMNHSAEISTPASYMIDLQESSLLVEAASDVRSGIMKVTPYATTKHEYFYLIFKASDTMYNESYIKISQPDDDLSSESEGIDNIEYVRLENEKEKIFGNSLAISSPVHRWYQSKQKNANFSGHHYFMTSRPACEYGMIEDYRYIKKNQLIGVSNKKGTVAAYLKFKSSLGEVRIATGTSFVSVEKAKQNLYSELGYGANFAEDLWSEFYLSPDASHLTDFGKKKKSRIVNSADRMGSNDSVFDMNKLINKVTSIWEEKLGAIKAVPFINNNESKKSLDLDKFQRAGGQTISSNSSKNQLITFYSSLWHTQLLPRVISDYDGQYLSFSEKKRILMNTSPKNNFHNYFDDFSMWDIFRAQLPLFTLAYTENIYDMVKSLIKKAEEGDWLPIFPAWNSYTDEMIGDHCGVFISDCYFKNLLSINHYNDKINDNYDDDDNNENNSISTNNYLLKQTYKYLIKNALSIPSDDDYKKGKGRRALESYMTYGFIPLEDEILDSAHTKQQVSRTLEYAYDDYVVSQLAKYYSKSILDEMYGIEVLDPQRNIIKNNEKLQRLLTDLIDSEKNEKILLERSQNYRWVIDGNTDNIWYEKKLDQYHGDKVNLNDNLSVIDVKYEKKGGKINLDKNDGKMNDEKRREGNGKEESVGFVRGRHANLSWTENFDSFDPSKYYTWLTETNVWQYTFSVLHDVEGMIEVYGGSEKFISKLDEFFDNSWYNHGNEPDHHVLYLYAYVKGSAWKIQDKLRNIISSQYGPVERSMSGNDDAGQMSAWLILSSLGFYQVCPGCGGRSEYVFGIPLFSKIEINLPTLSSPKIRNDEDSNSGDNPSSENFIRNDKSNEEKKNENKNYNNLKNASDGNKNVMTDRRTLLIEAVRLNDSEADKYIQLVTWNGCPYDCAFFPHNLLASGGHLIAYLGPVPNKLWGGDGRKCMDLYIYPGDVDSNDVNINADGDIGISGDDKIYIERINGISGSGSKKDKIRMC